MFCTDKETIYPEFYPDTIVKSKDVEFIDKLTNCIIDNTELDYVFNTKDILLKEKSNYLLYNKKHDVNHFNDLSAFFAYQKLIEVLNASGYDIEPMKLEDFNIEYIDNNLDNIPNLVNKNGNKASQLSESVFTNIGIQINTWTQLAYSTSNKNFDNIIVFRDSFFGGYTNGESGYIKNNQDKSYFNGLILKYLPEHFNNSYFIHYSNISQLKLSVEHYNSKIVILEFAERALNVLPGTLNNYN